MALRQAVETMDSQESVLLRRFVQEQDADAFAEIIRRYSEMVYGTCLRITENRESAADATQETFFYFLRNASKVTGSVTGWLYRVARGKAIDSMRRDAARRRREEVFASDFSDATSDSWAEISPLIDGALAELDEESRDVLLRHFLAGQTMLHIAAEKGISQPTVSRRVEKALSQLREKLSNRGVLVKATILGSLMSHSTQAVPMSIVRELGRMALTLKWSPGLGAAKAAFLGWNIKTAAIFSLLTLSTALFLGVRERDSANRVPKSQAGAEDLGHVIASPQSNGQMLSEGPASVQMVRAADYEIEPISEQKTPPAPNAASVASLDPTRSDQPVPSRPEQFFFGGRAPGFGPTGQDFTVNFLSEYSTVATLTQALAQTNYTVLHNCFADTSLHRDGFLRLLQGPSTSEEMMLKVCLQSVDLPIEIAQVTSDSNITRVRWRATVKNEFVFHDGSNQKKWARGEKFEFEATMQRIAGEWKIIEF